MISPADRAPFARHPVLGASAVVAVLLTAVSSRYDFHRDELYFRMLRPAWGYVDQPPLVPWLARTLTGHLADEPWALRLPATLCAAAAVIVIAQVCRELGGDARAQALTAWTYAFAMLPMLLGHVLLTSSIDLLAWLLVGWFALRAVLGRPRWWVAAGAVAGAATYGRWLITWLVLGIVLGLLLVGPRRVFRSRWLWLGALVGLAVAAPNLVFQVTHDLPQLRMGQALGANNAAEVRVSMWWFLLVMLGPPLAPVCALGLVALWRRPQWRPVRFLVVVFVVVVALTFVSGAQMTYPIGIVSVLLAAGWVGRRPSRVVLAVLGLGAAVSMLVALPVLPQRVVAASPLPSVNVVTADQLGWPTYTRQIATVWWQVPSADRAHAAVVTSNYGEAGAVARYGTELGLPAPFSGHNALADQGRPADDVSTVLLVGGQLPAVKQFFAECTVVTELESGLEVDNEEEGVPVAICRTPNRPWAELWPEFAHLD